MSCDPNKSNLIVYGINNGTTFSVTRQINKELLDVMGNEIFTANRVASISHLIARGLHWYLSHPKKMGWDIDYNEGFCGISPSESVPSESMGKIATGKIVHIHGTQPRDSSHTVTLAFPLNLWTLVDRHVSTDRGQKVVKPNAQVWINHLIARGLWIYQQPGPKPTTVHYTDTNFGISDWPAGVVIDEPGPHIRIPPPFGS